MRRFFLFLIGASLLIGSALLSQSTVKNPHGNLKWDCQDCHTTESWSKMRDSLQFKHDATGFVLVGSHATAQCIGCHKSPLFSNVGVACADCHADRHNGQLGQDCDNCHTPRDWQNRRSTLEMHASRGFALTGAHAVADCEACHVGHARQEYAGTPMVCYDCHTEAYSATQDPNHARAGFSTDCKVCHQPTASTWRNVEYHHPAAFPLVGGHQGVACKACHATQYVGLATDCYSCHEAVFAATTDPNHVTGAYPHDCTQCHTIYGWKPATFDHSLTVFPLTGAHLQATCISCHATQYKGTPTACYACHQAVFDQSTDPNHVLAQFDHDCTKCHTTSAWKPSSFNHSTTGFVLTGKHVSATCSGCHSTTFAGTPTDCYSCHQAAFEGVTSPNHVQQGFGHDCTVCHTTAGWTPSTFNHATTAFPLTGLHVNVACNLCHASGYAGTPTDCYSCHQGVYASGTNPNHALANFGHDCTTCHTTSGWTPSSYNHSVTGYTLTGTHITTACNLCHATAYAGTPTDCYSCHQAAYQGVADPNHVTGNFDHNCLTCHNTTSWAESSFSHALTSFALTGQHLTIGCNSCHAAGYTGTPTTCYACHQSSFATATNPNHVTAGFPTDCQTCHTSSGWTPSSFNHATTAFPLTGAHTTVTCISCHAGGYVSTPTDCYSCHQSNFESSTNPNHVLASFSQDCTGCHTTTAWTPSSFNHTVTGYALTGAHTTVTCVSCHATVYAGTPTDCYSCHQAAYQGVVDPNHVTNNFDHNCLTCHNNTAWTPSTFNHATTAFPLTGAHTTVTCVSCHASGYTGTSTACYSCHQSNFTSSTNPNHVLAGFSQDCTGCHTTTAWTPSSFSHSSTGYTLTGAHTTVTCISCHATAYAGTPTDCYSCHQAAYQGVVDPNHVTNNFDHICTTCHTTYGLDAIDLQPRHHGFPTYGSPCYGDLCIVSR